MKQKTLLSDWSPLYTDDELDGSKDEWKPVKTQAISNWLLACWPSPLIPEIKERLGIRRLETWHGCSQHFWPLEHPIPSQFCSTWVFFFLIIFTAGDLKPVLSYKALFFSNIFNHLAEQRYKDMFIAWWDLGREAVPKLYIEMQRPLLHTLLAEFCGNVYRVHALDSHVRRHQWDKVYPGLGHIRNRRYEGCFLLARSLEDNHFISLSSWKINRDINWQWKSWSQD